MGRYLRYLLRGAKNALVVGTPDFSKNNQYQDMVNIGNDFDVAIRSVSGEKERTTTRSRERGRKSSHRKLGAKQRK